jgi:hypothetical protein
MASELPGPSWWPLPFSVRAETAVSTAFMGGFHGRALATAVLPACGEAGRIKGGGGQGRSLRAVRRMGWGMRTAMGEVWEIHPWISIRVPFAFHSRSIRVPFSRTARRGRPCHSRSILADGSERPSLPFHVHPCRSGGRQTWGHSS